MRQEDTETQGKTSNNTPPITKRTQTQTKILSPMTGALSRETDLAPSTTDLLIRAELPAQTVNQLQQEIPNIQGLLLHVERKGKAKNTIIAVAKNLKALAGRGNLQNPEEIALAIARYKVEFNVRYKSKPWNIIKKPR
jgi:hypothetical protein